MCDSKKFFDMYKQIKELEPDKAVIEIQNERILIDKYG